jgi:hypothetical protein
MNCRHVAWVTVALTLAIAGCASPLENQLNTGGRDPAVTVETDEPRPVPPDPSEPQPPPDPEPLPEPEPAPEPPPPQPAAKGAPLDIAIFSLVGAPYSENQAFVEDEISQACGGTLCVDIEIVFASGGPESLTCTVESIDQPDPIFAGDTITFTLNDECEEPAEGEVVDEVNESELVEDGDVEPESGTISTEEPGP